MAGLPLGLGSRAHSQFHAGALGMRATSPLFWASFGSAESVMAVT